MIYRDQAGVTHTTGPMKTPDAKALATTLMGLLDIPMGGRELMPEPYNRVEKLERVVEMLLEAIPTWGPESRQAFEESIAVAAAQAVLDEKRAG